MYKLARVPWGVKVLMHNKLGLKHNRSPFSIALNALKRSYISPVVIFNAIFCLSSHLNNLPNFSLEESVVNNCKLIFRSFAIKSFNKGS